MADSSKGRGKKRGHYHGPVLSKAQQGYIFGVLAKKDPKAQQWGRKWAHKAGETGNRTPSSRAAYKALPRRKGAKKR